MLLLLCILFLSIYPKGILSITMSHPAELGTNLPKVSSIRWGIVGVGEVCEVKSGPAFYKAKQSSLQAVMRRTKSKAEDYARRHSVPQYYTEVEALINDENVDAIYVSTPPGLLGSGLNRVEIAQCIVNAGKPAYFEKPLARDAVEAQKIVDLFKEANLNLYVAYYRRYMPKFKNVKENVFNQNMIGNLTSIRLTLHQSNHVQGKNHRWHYNKEVSGGGKFMDVGCHMLDLVEYFVGSPLEDVRGIALKTNSLDNCEASTASNVEDSVHGIWSHSIKTTEGASTIERKVPGSCSFNFSSGGLNIDEILISGTKGSISMSCFDNEKVKITLFDDKTRENGSCSYHLDHDNLEHVQLPIIQAISNELLQKMDQDPVVCTGESALRTSVVCDMLLNNRMSWDQDYV